MHITCHVMNYCNNDRFNACTDIYVCDIGNGIPCHLVMHITCHVMNCYDVDRFNACTDIYVCAIGNGIPCHAHNLSCYELL